MLDNEAVITMQRKQNFFYIFLKGVSLLYKAVFAICPFNTINVKSTWCYIEFSDCILFCKSNIKRKEWFPTKVNKRHLV